MAKDYSSINSVAQDNEMRNFESKHESNRLNNNNVVAKLPPKHNLPSSNNKSLKHHKKPKKNKVNHNNYTEIYVLDDEQLESKKLKNKMSL